MQGNRRKIANFALSINANMKNKIIHLNLKEPFNGEHDYYFGSIIAIYNVIPAELLGIGYKSLTNALRGRERYYNKRISIHVSTLHRSPNVKPKKQLK